MDKEKLQEQRESIARNLWYIVSKYFQVQAEMENVPHEKGIARRSLEHKTGASIVSSKEGFTARYQHTNGHWYEISIHDRTPSSYIAYLENGECDKTKKFP